jgi:hypothetical protein
MTVVLDVLEVVERALERIFSPLTSAVGWEIAQIDAHLTPGQQLIFHELLWPYEWVLLLVTAAPAVSVALELLDRMITCLCCAPASSGRQKGGGSQRAGACAAAVPQLPSQLHAFPLTSSAADAEAIQRRIYEAAEGEAGKRHTDSLASRADPKWPRSKLAVLRRAAMPCADAHRVLTRARVCTCDALHRRWCHHGDPLARHQRD